MLQHHRGESMQTGILLGLLLLSAVAAQTNSLCRVDSYVEAILLQDCAVTPKNYSQADVKCLVIERTTSKGLPKKAVTKLTLALNYISGWSAAPIFSRMIYLNSLRLDGNKIHVLNDSMYNDVANVSNVRICYNPWDCTNCDIKNVRLFLLETGRNHCCVDCAVCSAHQKSLSNILVVDAAPGTEQACRPPDYYVTIGVPIIMVFLFGSAEPFLWDAFVSYHNSDAEWVREHVVPTLESTLRRFRLCVAERDFIPGLPITENVCRGIAQSRKSLFVLSRQFCESRWCMFELTLAQHRLFESERENEMVFIRRQPMDDSSLCPLLRYLLRTKTYVQAPPEDAEESVHDYFWLQLRAALEF
ncbi:hypothetical protein MTO96_021521 [Rhipicephalus appendiculatus]